MSKIDIFINTEDFNNPKVEIKEKLDLKVRGKIAMELGRLKSWTSMSGDDYLGSEEQINNEIQIVNELSKLPIDNEMLDRESIEEYYSRMLKLTRKLK